MNNLYIYPDTKYAGDVNGFFTEPYCAITYVLFWWLIDG